MTADIFNNANYNLFYLISFIIVRQENAFNHLIKNTK